MRRYIGAAHTTQQHQKRHVREGCAMPPWENIVVLTNGNHILDNDHCGGAQRDPGLCLLFRASWPIVVQLLSSPDQHQPVEPEVFQIQASNRWQWWSTIGWRVLDCASQRDEPRCKLLRTHRTTLF